MKLLDQTRFEKACGRMMPLRRNMDNFNGDGFRCACGSQHTFDTLSILVLTEGFNGRFVVVCPSNPQVVSLIKTRMKWGMIYQGLELVAGHSVAA